MVATLAECAQRVQFEWRAARAAREACGARAAYMARGLGGRGHCGHGLGLLPAFQAWLGVAAPMPDALFHYGLHAHMRSSCIRRRYKKSIFPVPPLVPAALVDFLPFLHLAFFGIKPVALQMTRMLLQQWRHYSRAVFPTPQRTRSTTLKSWAPSSNLRIT